MSASAAMLQCPLCLHPSIFDTVEALIERLACTTTNKVTCPVCQEEVIGFENLSTHLFGHVKQLSTQRSSRIQPSEENNKSVQETQPKVKQQRASKAITSKNKPSPPSNAPVKYVKIYPKLPVVSPNYVKISAASSNYSNNMLNGICDAPEVMKAEGLTEQINTTCNICGLQFVDVNILKMHKCLIHNIEDDKTQTFTRYNCHLCPKNFKMRGSLMVHLRVAHFGFSSGINDIGDKNTSNESQNNQNDIPLLKNDNKQWQCEVCRKCFTTKYFLKKHKRLHTGETPYACKQCNKTFTFQQSYHKHLLYHNDEKPHICSSCGRAFKELSTLHNHQRIHTGEKPFSCETCGKCFRQRVSYLVHRRIHTGVMPYKCTSCNKSFRYKVSQRTHKCPAQPPGTVVRQNGNLVEKLKKKQTTKTEEHQSEDAGTSYHELSEINAEIIRSGAKLSLEDTESEHFTMITEAFSNQNEFLDISTSEPLVLNDLPDTSSHRTIDGIPIEEKCMPSPTEIFKNLCLTQEDDFTCIDSNVENLQYTDCMYTEFI